MLQRMLVERMENRILVGITMFVGIMLLVGWVAINENARMTSFERQFDARAVERGAAMFAQYCSTCHGPDGHGISNYAPALNSPHFFGFNYFAQIDSELEALTTEQTALRQESIDLATELIATDTTPERATEIETRLLEIRARLNGDDGVNAQVAALTLQRQDLVTQLQPAVFSGYPLSVDASTGQFADPNYYDRLRQMNWGGTREQFIVTTLIHGRPTSIGYWGGNQMVSFSQRTGGNLRDDQLEDLAAYILNWDKGEDWTVADALAVNQFGRIPGQETGSDVDTAGTDVQAIVADLPTLNSDPARGEALYNRQQPTGANVLVGCGTCHVGAVNGPNTEGKWDDALSVRLQLPQFAGYSVQQYMVESIVQPQAYSVPGFSAQMPANFGQQLTVQDIADILAYLHSFSQLDPLTDDDLIGTGGAEETPEVTAEATAEATPAP